MEASAAKAIGVEMEQPRAAPSSEEGEVRARFAALQAAFAGSYQHLVADRNAPRTVVIVPSLTLDQDVMARVTGAHHYEERMLCLLLLLGLPRTNVVFVTSTPIPEPIIDYYLHLLPGIPAQHARRRLLLLSCHDASRAPLTAKILARPRLIRRIAEALPDPASAHMTCFTVTPLERELAVALGVPIYGCDPDLAPLGSKSGSRRAFRAAGIAMPAGFEDLRDTTDVVEAFTELKAAHPALGRAVVKLEEGFSGEGNAVMSFADAPAGRSSLKRWVRDRMSGLAFEARGMSWELYEQKLGLMGGIVEEFLEGDVKRSPSAQMRVDPVGHLDIISTHDQVLGGGSGQIFLGCRFPADAAYRLEIQAHGLAIGHVLAEQGVLGRFGVDFLSVRDGDRWRHWAIEINLRKGGTTHPFQMLQFLTDGQYDSTTGQFLTAAGRPRCYYATDNLESENYRGLTPHDLIDIAATNGLHFNAASQEGVSFHLIGALSEFGKLGLVAIGGTQDRADALYRRVVETLDREACTIVGGG